MTTPSRIAAVTLALRSRIQDAMPPNVDVSALPPAQAEQPLAETEAVARVNVVCYRFEPNPSFRNAESVRPDHSGNAEQRPWALDLSYLVTVYGAPIPEQEHSTERLLEAVYWTVENKPSLGHAELDAALPGNGEPYGNLTARITQQLLSMTELQALFSSMHAVYRPSLAYTIMLST